MRNEGGQRSRLIEEMRGIETPKIIQKPCKLAQDHRHDLCAFTAIGTWLE